MVAFVAAASASIGDDDIGGDEIDNVAASALADADRDDDAA